MWPFRTHSEPVRLELLAKPLDPAASGGEPAAALYVVVKRGDDTLAAVPACTVTDTRRLVPSIVDVDLTWHALVRLSRNLGLKVESGSYVPPGSSEVRRKIARALGASREHGGDVIPFLRR